MQRWQREEWAPCESEEELDVEGPGPRAPPPQEAGEVRGHPPTFAITEPSAPPEETDGLGSLTNKAGCHLFMGITDTPAESRALPAV